MGTPGAHPSGQPCEEEGEKLGIKTLSSMRGLSKNQGKICFTEEKIPPYGDTKGFVFSNGSGVKPVWVQTSHL